jgi:ribosomal protein S18 acetylase RimI-like enzyme
MSASIELACVSDAEEILALQKLAFARFPSYLPPQQQTLSELQEQMMTHIVLKLMQGDCIAASVRVHIGNRICEIKRLIVHPQFQRQGLARQLMAEVEKRFANVDRLELHTGVENEQSYALYTKLGYRELRRGMSGADPVVYMEKTLR